MSKFDHTFWTSSWSSSASISRTICCAVLPSSLVRFLRQHRDRRAVRLDQLAHRFGHGVEGGRSRDDFPVVAVVAQVVGAGVERRGHQRLFVDLRLLDDDVALALEHPGHAVLGAEVAPVLAEHVADLADGAVAVVGDRLDDHRGAAGAVALVGDFLVADARFLTRAATDRSRDVVVGHVRRLGIGDDGAEPRVHPGVAAADAGGDGQFLDDAREDLAALGVEGALLVLDGVPLGMARHNRAILAARAGGVTVCLASARPAAGRGSPTCRRGRPTRARRSRRGRPAPRSRPARGDAAAPAGRRCGTTARSGGWSSPGPGLR